MENNKNSFSIDNSSLEKMLLWAKNRINLGPDPLSGAKNLNILDKELGDSITKEGLGWEEAFELFTNVIVPSTRPFDHPTSLAFVAAAPTPAASSIDAVLGAAEIFAGNWDGGSGAIHAENQALKWIASLAGWSTNLAGGVFVSGGTLGNLSALHAARVAFRSLNLEVSDKLCILCSSEAHSSINSIAKVIDVDLIEIPSDEFGRIKIKEAKKELEHNKRIFCIVANAGATNSGAVDDIDSLADLAKLHNIWLHVDGSYGLAALADPESSKLFSGIERADSLIVDPHKWLFAPYDSCALIYRESNRGSAAHGQQDYYLDVVDKTNWNPSDFALHLTRRPRGLPLWFSLAVYGSQSYSNAIKKTLQIANKIAEEIKHNDDLELILGPQLTVILFSSLRLSDNELYKWSEKHRRDGTLLCLPTKWKGKTVLRICVVNPNTDANHVAKILKTLK